jgi:hypothetical protein
MLGVATASFAQRAAVLLVLLIFATLIAYIDRQVMALLVAPLPEPRLPWLLGWALQGVAVLLRPCDAAARLLVDRHNACGFGLHFGA